MKTWSRNAHGSAHPSGADSVMNYDSVTGVNEPDCSPNPLDILAIRVLYQALNP